MEHTSEMTARVVGTRELSEAVMALGDLFASRHWKWWDRAYAIDSLDPNSLRVPDAETIMQTALYLITAAAADTDDNRYRTGRLMAEACPEPCSGCNEDGTRCVQLYVQVGEVRVR